MLFHQLYLSFYLARPGVNFKHILLLTAVILLSAVPPVVAQDRVTQI